MDNHDLPFKNLIYENILKVSIKMCHCKEIRRPYRAQKGVIMKKALIIAALLIVLCAIRYLRRGFFML